MSQEPKQFPINGVLDLHTFKPDDIGSLIPEYIEACLEKDITSLRIIHGKGTGALRRGVHALLDRNPHVVSYGLATDKSSWGATLVEISRDANSGYDEDPSGF
ncbi:MAG: Smr/MutS family protein [Balneolaceae bacterium]